MGFGRPSLGQTSTHVSGLVGAGLPSGQRTGSMFKVGGLVGNEVGALVGSSVGDKVGSPVGDTVGSPVGELVG